MKIDKMIVLTAHCDDEFLFLFPAFYSSLFSGIKKKVVCVTSDIVNPRRVWAKERKKGFADVCRFFKVDEFKCLDYSSRFYSMENDDLAMCVEEVRAHIQDADAIFTHNAWGEYGHLDHAMCHQIARMTGKPVFTTDICLQADWYIAKPYYQGSVIGEAENDMFKHAQCMGMYDQYGAMRWRRETIIKSNIIQVQPAQNILRQA